MLTSKYYQSSCRTYNWTLLGVLSRSPVSHMRRLLPAPLVRVYSYHLVRLYSHRADFVARLKQINNPLRLLVENEIFRLTVWSNPCNESKRGVDPIGTTERAMQDVRGCFAIFTPLAPHQSLSMHG